MRNYRTLLVCFLPLHFLVCICLGQAPLRQRINIDRDWRFHFGNAADPARDFNYGIATVFSKSASGQGTAISPGFADTGWRRLDLPHDWATELPFVEINDLSVEAHGYKPVGGRFPETSIGWYRKHLRLAAADSGGRYQLSFDGIFRNANIWINGFFLGNNPSGYIGAAYDITDYLHFGGDNVIVVRVDASQYEGWFYEGAGIYRHVWLDHYSSLHISDGGLFVHAALAGNPGSLASPGNPGKPGNRAVVSVETSVANQQPVPAGGTVACYITDRDGRRIAQTKATAFRAGADQQVLIRQELPLAAARLWSPDDPYLYRITALVSIGGRVVDTVQQRFGVRTFRFDSRQGFLLNGKPLKILGVNNHQDHAGIGAAIPDELNYYRITCLKEMGANAWRTSHNPPAPALLDACDSLGMLVLDETRLLNSSPEYMNQFERMILRDRNHASIFLWSIGNEEAGIQTTDIGKRIAQSLMNKQRELDPYRTSTYAADLPNVYQGINSIIPVRGFNYRQAFVDAYHQEHPDQPLLGTEMGSTVTTRGIYTTDSIRGYLPDQDITFPYWASRAEDWWTLAAENPYWLGGFVWTGFDYRGEPTPYHWPNINSHFGLMDICGFPKNIYYYYQSWWTNKDVLHISPHWNWPDKKRQPIDVWVNSNADSVELFLNGSSLGRKNMPRNGHLVWQVNYAPGVLAAVGYKQGRQIRTQIETTGQPVRVVLTPFKQALRADGNDVTVVNVSVLDEAGHEVPDADKLICFSLKGKGRIIGVGNGDPSSHEADQCEDGAWQRRLFNGKCQLIIRSDDEAGTIDLEAAASGLSKAVLHIPTFTGTFTGFVSKLPPKGN